MKKCCILIISVLLLFSACSSAQGLEGTLSSLVSRVQNAISKAADFVTAEEDFTADHIGSPSYLDEGVVCFGADGKTREFGVFRLTDRTKATEFKESLRAYLKNEQEALSSLVDLYPAEELEQRLALYENATVGNEGMLVYYFVLDETETAKALHALTGR